MLDKGHAWQKRIRCTKTELKEAKKQTIQPFFDSFPFFQTLFPFVVAGEVVAIFSGHSA